MYATARLSFRLWRGASVYCWNFQQFTFLDKLEMEQTRDRVGTHTEKIDIQKVGVCVAKSVSPM